MNIPQETVQQSVAGATHINVPTDESLSLRSNKGLRRLVFWQSCLLVSQATVGYDEVLVGSLQTMPKWLEDMGNPGSSFLGLLVSVVFVGGFVGAFVAAPVSDRYGRRAGIAVGSVLCIIGTVLQSAAQERGMFLAGRVIIGIGISFTTCAGPTLVNELSHPALRGTISSMFNVLWYVGSIFAAWISFGTSHMETSSWCWRIPSIVQAVPAIFVACVIFMIPESPRYLYSRGLISEAEDVLTTYHANSDPTNPIIALELQEISTALSAESEFSKASFLSTLRSRENRRCYAICVSVALLTLWCGQGVISYYFSPILTSIGITSPGQQTGINGGMQIWNLLCSITGALLADRIGRRALWLSSFSGMILFNVPLTITSAVYAHRGTKSAASATVALLFLYNAAFNLACNPLLYTYTPEILPYSIRARGLSLQIAVSEAALTVNQYVNPIALHRIGYYYYIFYLGVLFVGLAIIYLFFPETNGKTLEELSGLFVEAEVGSGGDIVKANSLSDVKNHIEAHIGNVGTGKD